MSAVAETTATQAATQAGAPSWPAAGYAWYVMTVLMIAYMFAIVDRSIISLLVQPIKADLHITDAQIGLLQGLAFAICYTTFGLVLGFVTDRTDRRMLLAGSIFIWSIATIACGFASSFEMLFISRIFVGLGEACMLPVAGSLIADYLPPTSRPRGFGLMQLGGSIGTGAGNYIGGHAAATTAFVQALAPTWVEGLHHWQITFLIVGVPGILVALAFALTVREPTRREKAQVGGLTLKPLFAHVRLNWLAYTSLLGAAALNVLCIYAQITWAPTFLIRVFGWTPENVSLFLIVSLMFGATSPFTVAWLMSSGLAKGRSDAPMIAILVHGVALMILGPLAYASPNPWVMAVFYMSMSLGATWSTSAALMGVTQITPNELRGQLTAFYTLLSGLISLSAGAYFVGVLSDRVFTAPTGLRWSLFTVYLAGGALSIVLLIAGRPAYRAAAQRALAWAEQR